MRFIVDTTGVNPELWANSIDVSTKAGVRKIAEELRDEMRSAYDKSIHGTIYGDNSTGAYSLRNFIVVNDMEAAMGVFSVGAKRSQVVGNQLIEEIFAYMDQGTGQFNGGPSHWVFKLPGDRAGASENGFWATTGQEGKGFITDTANAYMSGRFQSDAIRYVAPLIDASLKIKI